MRWNRADESRHKMPLVQLNGLRIRSGTQRKPAHVHARAAGSWPGPAEMVNIYPRGLFWL